MVDISSSPMVSTSQGEAMRWSLFDCSMRVAALLVATGLCSCAQRGPGIEAPSVIAESTETIAPQNAELIKRCLPFATGLADSMHLALGPLHFTHSDKWGDILRVDISGKDSWATRLACSNNKNVVGVVPSGIEELVPSQMQGVWAEEGKCRAQSERLVITSTAAQFGTRQPFEIRYFPNRDTPDQGEFWTTDATWLTPQYDPAKDAMVWTDKNGTTIYRRCPNRD